ncbi:hypothetical protein ACFQL4_18340 [Halosimplex aquaticum]
MILEAVVPTRDSDFEGGGIERHVTLLGVVGKDTLFCERINGTGSVICPTALPEIIDSNVVAFVYYSSEDCSLIGRQVVRFAEFDVEDAIVNERGFRSPKRPL